MIKNTIFNPKQITIINADDFGYNSHIDRGIIQLINQQRIKSISVLVNGGNVVQAVKLMEKLQKENIQKYLNCSMGLHFNLTEGRPLNPALNETELVQGGIFRGKICFYQIINNTDTAVDLLIEEEIRLQILQFIKLFKRRPSHLDGHNHIHLIPRIAKIIANAMAETGIYRVRTLNQKLGEVTIPINNTFMTNNAISQSIYSAHKIISPNRFVGLQSFGSLKTSLIDTSFKLKQQECKQYKSVQLMCHPGYPDQNGVPWIASIDRLNQKNQLQSEQFAILTSTRGIHSYFDLKAQENSYTPKVLIYSKLDKATGNHTTTLRLRTIFQKLGFKVYLWNVSDLLDLRVQASDLSKFLVSFGITLIVGVNASRSAQIIYQATITIAVPFIFVIAGTDANITFKNPTLLQRLHKALKNSQCLISLSSNMAQITKNTLTNIGITKSIYTIVQSSCLSQHLQSDIYWNRPSNPYIILPTSFRQVKCVHHLLEQFNKIIEQYHINVYIAGPILDEQYYQQCKNKLGKVIYLGVLSKPIYAKYLKEALAMINTSESEGMSCSILQAFQICVPVIARKNSGNEQLIKHQFNGLIYNQPHQFISLLLQLKENQSLRTNLIRNSHQLFKLKYNYQQEFQSYEQVLQDIYFSKLFTYQSQNKWIKVLNQQNLHPTSPVNNSLFLQIQPEIANGANLLDLGCGTGIFSLIFIAQSNANDLQVHITDISFDIASKALYNYRQSSIWHQIKSITCIQSNLFQNIENQKTFDAVLFNPPQTPFRNPANRLDKNGGPHAIKFYSPILQYIAQHPPTNLYLLHSYMAWPTQLTQLLKTYHLQMVWQSKEQVHKINREAYNQMQPQLAQYILNHIREGRAKVVYEDDIFYVPAVIYRIRGF